MRTEWPIIGLITRMNMWNVPLAKRHLKLDPGHAGYRAVDWALYGILATVGASAVALIGFVALVSFNLK